MVKTRLRNVVVTACHCAVACTILLSSAVSAVAERASLVVDADSSAVFHAKNARLQSYPASLTKLMTAYLLFEAMASKNLALTDRLHVSAAAARMPAVRLGLKQGQTITLEKVIAAIIARSANDAAVVAAEGMAGSEPAFANLMNIKAKLLGMSDTLFYNASGLPHPGQVTSARDMGILARAMMTDYSHLYSSFSSRTFQYGGKTFNVSNQSANRIAGIQGLKTGFTCNAGYNLVASVESNGRRLIGVVLGERNLTRRNDRMSKILKEASNPKHDDKTTLTIQDLAAGVDQGNGQGLNKKVIADVCDIGSKAIEFARASGWGLVLAVKKKPRDALSVSRRTQQQFPNILKSGRPLAIPFLRGVPLNRACITNLSRESAAAACQQLRNQGHYCIVVNPKLVRMYVEKGRLALEKGLITARNLN